EAKQMLEELSKIKIKCHLGDDIRLLVVSNGISFSSLKQMAEEKFCVKLVDIKFKDEDGDLITLSQDDDIVEALGTMKLSSGEEKNKKLDLYLTKDEPVVDSSIEVKKSQLNQSTSNKKSPQHTAATK